MSVRINFPPFVKIDLQRAAAVRKKAESAGRYKRLETLPEPESLRPPFSTPSVQSMQSILATRVLTNRCTFPPLIERLSKPLYSRARLR